MVDVGGVVEESNEINNSYSQTVRVIPSWVPRILGLKVVDTRTAAITFEATGHVVSGLALESTTLLANPTVWHAESNSLITTNALGNFEARLPLQGSMRFHRVRATTAVPGSQPRMLGIKIAENPHVTLTFEAEGLTTTEFSVEAASSPASLAPWVVAPNTTITMIAPGKFEAQIPLRDGMRFYRVRLSL